MIILAAAIILSLSNSGIIGKANKAKTDTDVSNAKDLVAMAHADWMLDEAKIMAEDSSITSFGKYAEKKLKEAGYKVDRTNGSYTVSDDGVVNTLYVENGKTAVTIPDGFTYLEGTVDGGVVIQDSKGNEFVWVPVDDITKFERTTTYDGTITALDSDYAEPYTTAANDTTGEYAEYTAMKASVEKYKGFYIGRYEAGKEDLNVVIKKESNTYNSITWNDAVELSRNMYKECSSATSTLVYGVQWDATLTFIYKTESTYITSGIGWNSNNSMSDNIGHLTGKDLVVDGKIANKVCNIYDMSGNMAEWTMECYDSAYRVLRGGGFQLSSTQASGRNNSISPSTKLSHNGFRVALYLK